MAEPDGLLVAFMDHLGVRAWVKDGEGRYLYANPLCERTFLPPGLTGSMVGRTDDDLFSADVAAVLRDHDRQVLRGGDALEFIEEVPSCEETVHCWFAVKFPIPVGDDRHVGGVAVDVTRWRNLELKNREVEARFRQILDAISDMVFVKRPGSRLQWANRAFREFYGMSNDQLRGLIDAPFNEPDYTQKYLRDDREVFETGRPLDIPEEPVTRHDGKVIPVHTVKSPIFDSEGRVTSMVGVSRDIAERKRLEHELSQAQKLESVGRLASGIAHEINTPIQFVGDYVQFVRQSFDDLLGLQRHYREVLARAAAGPLAAADLAGLRAAEEEADLAYMEAKLPDAFVAIGEGISRVAKLVAAMKEFGHPDRGEPSLADLNRALRTTLTIVGNETGQVADVETDLGELPPVLCVLSDLNQVFVNLLVNAAHAIADVRPTRRGVIRVRTRQEGKEVVVSISDTGTGIPEKVRDRIFDPFFTTKEVGRGTGQGLPIARMIVVEKHRGSLTFETAVGTGTTFHVRIPIG